MTLLVLLIWNKSVLFYTSLTMKIESETEFDIKINYMSDLSRQYYDCFARMKYVPRSTQRVLKQYIPNIMFHLLTQSICYRNIWLNRMNVDQISISSIFQL